MTEEKKPKMATELELIVKLMSAEKLCVLTVESSWTIRHVKQLVQTHLDLGQAIKSLLNGSDELKDKDTLSAVGLEKDAEIIVVIIALPALHLFKPCSARELSERRGCGDKWLVGGCGVDHIVAAGVEHRSMQGLSPVTEEVVQEMAKLAPDLENTRVDGSESDENGEIMVISNPGDDPKMACFLALGFLDNDPEMARTFGNARTFCSQSPDLWQCTTLEEKDWGDHLKCGFNNDPDEDDGEEADAGLLAITKVMSQRLSRHFKFGLGDKIVVAPAIYGGYTTDGDIVGVLSARVWT